MQTSIPVGADSRPDFYNLIARERGCPEGWRWFSLEAVSGGFSMFNTNRSTASVIVKGAVCTAVITRGPREGQTNWSKRDRSTERTIVIAFADYDAREARWVAENASAGSP